MTCLTILALLALQNAPAPAAQTTPAAPGKTWFCFRMWPDMLVKFDPDTDTIAKTLKNHRGHGYDLELSHDRKQLFHVTGLQAVIEVVDIKSFERVDEHRFDEAGFVERIDQIREIPGGKRWYVKVDKVQKMLDHFVVQEPEWLEYDLEDHKVVKRMKELPKPIRRGARISPDGTKWHVFDRDITIIDPKTLEEEGKIELSKPQMPGMAAISVRGDDFYDQRNPDAYRFIYTMRDPINKARTLFGLVDIDLKKNEIGRLVEWGAAPRAGNWYMDANRTIAVATVRTGERRSQAEGRDPEITLYTLDLTTGKKVLETRIDVRNGLSVSAVSPSGDKIYLTGRGEEIFVYGRDHKQLKPPIKLPGDFDGWMMPVRE
jgi:hypothetical protein